jgi:hypothetical protein
MSSDGVRSQTFFSFDAANPANTGEAVMMYCCIVNTNPCVGKFVTSDPVELISLASKAVLQRTGQPVIAGMLGRNAWKEVWRQHAQRTGKDGGHALPWFVFTNIWLVRDRSLNDEVFECFVDGIAFYRRVSLLPNAARLIGPRGEEKYRKQLDMFGDKPASANGKSRP